MSDISRNPVRAILGGLSLNAPIDDPRLGIKFKFPYLNNIRSYQSGRIETRIGITKTSITAGSAADRPVHSIRRLNDVDNAAFTRIVGGGTKLWYGTGASLTQAATGFSGNPLSLVPFQPDQTPDPWMYVADSLKMAKIRRDGSTQSIGIAPPTSEPTAALAQPTTVDVDTMQATTGWAADNTVLDNGAISTIARVDSSQVTVGAAIGDVAGGGAGWYCIKPTDSGTTSNNIQPGTYLTFGTTGGGPQLVQTVRPSAFTTTVGSITYDSGSTGLCSIQPATPVDIDLDTMLYLNSAEYVRVTAVTLSPDGTVQSFRCTTIGTIAATQALVGVFSFRCYCSAAPTGTISRLALRVAFKTTGGGVGYITKTAALNLGKLGTRPILDEDEIHVSMRMSNLSELVEAKLLLNVDPSDSTFTQNVYAWSLQPSAFQSTVTNAATTQGALTSLVGQNVITTAPGLAGQDQNMDPTEGLTRADLLATGGDVPDTTSSAYTSDLPSAALSAYTGAGQSQWMEVRLKIGDAQKIGTAASRTLQSVTSIRISLNCTATSSAETVDFDAWWVGGTYGPDVGDIGTSYCYRTRGRSSVTGAKSNPGPAIRPGGGIRPRRQSVTLSFANMRTATDASWGQVDRIDVYRFGGSLNQWTLAGTVKNDPAVGATTLTFTDNYPDSFIATQPLLEENNGQPFVIIDKPRTGTCNVAGTTVTQVSGDTFSTAWDIGNVIQINGINYPTHNRPTSTTQVEIEDNGGTLSAVTWTIYAPVLIGQPLPAVWGTLENFMFGCGDLVNPGRLYWMNGNNPDGMAESNFLDVTSPSEPLMNGCIYDAKAFVWSTDRMFAIYPTFVGTILTGSEIIGDASGPPTPFRVIEIPNSQGLYTRWGFCVGPKIWQQGKDGLYETSGGAPVSITDADLYPWFPSEGNPGQTVNGILPPDLSYSNATTTAASFRLAWYDDMVYYDYTNTSGQQFTATYNTLEGEWYLDSFARQVVMHYGEEGTKDGFSSFPGAAIHSLLAGGSDGTIPVNGTVFQVAGTTDDGVDIPCEVRWPCYDMGSPRNEKTFADAYVDLDRGGVTITAQLGFDNYVTLPAATTLTTGAGRQSYILPVAADTIARNVALDLSWTGSGPLIYVWESTFYPKPDNTAGRATDWDDVGYTGAKWLQGVIIECDTLGQDKIVQVQGDGGAVIATLTINHNGQIEKPYSWDATVAAATTHAMRLVPTDTVPWRGPGTGDFKLRWVWNVEPELTNFWTGQPTSFDFETYSHIRDMLIPLRSSAQVDLIWTRVDDGSTFTYAIPSTGGQQKKTYVIAQPEKGKMWQPSLVAHDGVTGFRVYLRDLTVRVKPWGSTGPYSSIQPFGDISRNEGTKI